MQIDRGAVPIFHTPPVYVGISACLLGQRVRYDGGHKLSTLCNDRLAPFVQFVPLCPEEAIGLGTPRPPIHLIGDPSAPRVVGVADPSRDVTGALHDFGQRTAAAHTDLCGYILMQKSPSCGIQSVKVTGADHQLVSTHGTGAFAAALMRARPALPMEEEARLADPVLLENFISRVYAYAHWLRLQREGLTRQTLIIFHQRYKYQLMATDREEYQQLGRALAQSASMPLQDFASEYITRLMRALRRPATRGTHTNVLQHLAGYLKRDLPDEQRQELQRIITAYHVGKAPLATPVTLLRTHFSHHPNDYIAGQAYLQPHPPELALYDDI